MTGPPILSAFADERQPKGGSVFKGAIVAGDDVCYSGELRGRLAGFICGCSACRAHWPENRRKEIEDWLNGPTTRSTNVVVPNGEPKKLKELIERLRKRR